MSAMPSPPPTEGPHEEDGTHTVPHTVRIPPIEETLEEASEVELETEPRPEQQLKLEAELEPEPEEPEEPEETEEERLAREASAQALKVCKA